MVDRLAQFRDSFGAEWTKMKQRVDEERSMTPEKYRQHLQELPPERLVDYLKHFQSEQVTGVLRTILGGAVSVSGILILPIPIIITSLMTELAIASIITMYGGIWASVSGYRKAQTSNAALRSIYPELQRRLDTPSQPSSYEPTNQT